MKYSKDTVFRLGSSVYNRVHKSRAHINFCECGVKVYLMSPHILIEWFYWSLTHRRIIYEPTSIKLYGVYYLIIGLRIFHG